MTEEAQAVEAAAITTEVAAQTTTQAGWSDGLTDEYKGFVENKGWQSPGDVVESYRNLEKLRGVPLERLVTLPEDMSAEGALDPVFAKLGRPESAEKYTNALGEEFADDFYKQAAGQAHKLGLTDKQFAGMQEWMKTATGTMETQRRAEVDGAFADWSATNPQALDNAKRLATAAGVDAPTMDAILNGDKAKLFDLLGKVGSRMGEASVVQGEGDPEISLSPQGAQAKISQLLADKTFSEGYLSQNPKIRAPYMARMERLQQIAARSAQ